MPLSHSPLLEGFGYGGAAGGFPTQPAAGMLCQKRKLDFASNSLDQNMEEGEEQWLGLAPVPKRACMWPAQGNLQQPTQYFHHHQPPPPPQQDDVLPSCLEDRSQDCHTGFAPPPPTHISLQTTPEAVPEAVDTGMEAEKCGKELNNNNNNQSALTMLDMSSPVPACEVDSMESDYVPDLAQYIPTPSAATSSSSSTSALSAPQNIARSPDARCAKLSCSGLKPSPVTGRLHCLCSASWRGMYGMDLAYMSDYY